VIAIHCKAGKGRTGLIVSAFLLFGDYNFNDPDEAMIYYNKRRTMNHKGLTI
jgi:phosphatidylinositol-3,4,5-trisphosphate 3-phosphatase/dual-specificity protein phosphatase PTEN